MPLRQKTCVSGATGRESLNAIFLRLTLERAMSVVTVPARTTSHTSRALWLNAAIVATFFGASSAPTPLYALYQAKWGFSPVTLTVVFGTYAFSLLIALLVTGSLSDHIGRKPVIVAAVALEVVAMLMFAGADGVGLLILARATQGVATGAATSALGAAILDSSRTQGPLVNATASLFGMGLGALGAGLLVAHAPLPLQLIYIVLTVLLIFEGIFATLLPETVSKIPGAYRSLIPRVHVPALARGALARVAPVDIALWALGGFYLSLGPKLAHQVTGSEDIAIGGWVVVALTMSGVGAIVMLRKLPTRRLLMTGAASLAAGLAITLQGVHSANAAIFFAGTAVAGAGFGSSFQGALRSVLPLAKAHERAGLMAAFYVLSYLAFSVPAILAGTAIQSLGLLRTTDIYGGTLAILSLLTLVASMFTKDIGTPA
jgi:hypothetical protein